MYKYAKEVDRSFGGAATAKTMFTLETILVLLFFAAAVYLYYKKHGKTNLHLPGPWPLLSLPCVGHGYLLGSNPIKSLLRWRAQHGDVFRLDVGCLPTVFLCGWEVIDEALRSEAFSGRPYGAIPSFKFIKKHDSRGNPSGPAVISAGKVWREQRRFMMHNLNDLGMGSKDTMESVISQEVDYLCQRLRTTTVGKKGGANLKKFFLAAVNNVILRISTGKRSRQDDPELDHLTKSIDELLQMMAPGSPLNLLQLSNTAFLHLCFKLGFRNILDTAKPFNVMLERQVDEQKGAADADGHYVERLWAEVEKNAENPESSFHGADGRVHAVGQMFDLFVAGTDTVATFLDWAALYLCEYPELQDRLHRHVRDCFGEDGAISLSDYFRLPLVEAVVEEISRHCPMMALLLPHATVVDASVRGHFIPSGTQVFMFTTTVHMDEKLFKDAEKFDPDRFLDGEGRFTGKSDHVLLFGGHAGKRRCVGETLARAECFLFLATLVQRFRFFRADPETELNFEPVPGLVFSPQPCQVRVELRE